MYLYKNLIIIRDFQKSTLQRHKTTYTNTMKKSNIIYTKLTWVDIFNFCF